MILSPSPRPSPSRRGSHVIPFSEQRSAADWRRTAERFSLSPGERAGVRGKEVGKDQRLPNLKWLLVSLALLSAQLHAAEIPLTPHPILDLVGHRSDKNSVG